MDNIDKGGVNLLANEWNVTARDAKYVTSRDNKLLQISFFLIFIFSILTSLFLWGKGNGQRIWFFNFLVLSLTIIFFIYDFIKSRVRSKHMFKREIWLLKILLEHENVQEFYKAAGASISQEHFIKSNRINWLWDFDFVSHMRSTVVSNFIKRLNINNKRVIDMGCGNCDFLRILASYQNVCYGIELNRTLLKNRAKNMILYLCQADIMKIPFKSDSFDVVFCLEVLEHLLSPQPVLAEIERVLRPGGIFILATPNRNSVSLSHFLNPMKFATQFLALWFEGLLNPRPLINLWRKQYYFHTAFSIKELKVLFKQENFRVKIWTSYGIAGGLVGILLKMRPSVREIFRQLNNMECKGDTGQRYNYLRTLLLGFEKRYGNWLGKVNIFLQKIPLIKLIGTNHLIVLEKI